MGPGIARIEIDRLRVYARHGVMEQERRVGNTFEISVSVDYPAVRAIEEDLLDGTLNYAEAISLIRELMKEPSALLENVAGRIRHALCERWPEIGGGSVKVTKIAPPVAAQTAGVSVTIRW